MSLNRRLCFRPKSLLKPWPQPSCSIGTLHRCGLTTLAIESSCDDTSVAVVEKDEKAEVGSAHALIHYHKRITANNLAYRGIHPIASLDSHERHLSHLIQDAIKKLPNGKPDFVSVTRGPGMRSSLNVGLNTAKGLALAWNVPLVGVHHMQAHALTPRLVFSLATRTEAVQANIEPQFPFMTLLVSGGHTLLLSSTSLTNHSTLASTVDIAIGDCLDKIARMILPEAFLATAESTMYGALLERFAFPINGYKASSPETIRSVNDNDAVRSVTDVHGYAAPATRRDELERRHTYYGWSLTPPLSETRGGRSRDRMEFSFTGLVSAAQRIAEKRIKEDLFAPEERILMAKETMRVAFEHLASRVILALKTENRKDQQGTTTIVVSGGVAANAFLKTILRTFLDSRGHGHIRLVFPPLDLCTDNAAMIGWAGIEMFEAGFVTDFASQSISKWSLDSEAVDGGLLGVPGWHRHVWNVRHILE